jgi:hypothetical protein
MVAGPDFIIPDNDNNNDFVDLVNQKLGGLEKYIEQKNKTEGQRIDQINQMLAEIEQRIREIQRRLSESRSKAGDIDRNINANKNNIQINKKKIEELEAEKQLLQQQLAENQRRIGELTLGIEEAKNRGDGRRAAELAAQLATLKRLNDDALAKQKDTATKSIEELRQEIVELQLENAALQAKYNDLMQAMKRAFKLLESMNNRRPNSGDLSGMFIKIRNINSILDGAGANTGAGTPVDDYMMGNLFDENLPPPSAAAANAEELAFQAKLAAEPPEIQALFRPKEYTDGLERLYNLYKTGILPDANLKDRLRSLRGGRKTKKYKKRRGKKSKTAKKRVKSRKQKGGYLILHKSKHRHKTHSRQYRKHS